jgi:REP element-mobilizing transposase RayT
MAELKYRKNIRLQNCDYIRHGVFFITICSKNGEWIFSEIKDNSVSLLKMGEIIEIAIKNIPKIYENVNIDCFVIMPNHIHMILIIDPNPRAKTVGISTIINQFKGYVTKQIGYSPWHRHFHDHIVRDHEEYVKIADYIKNNPVKWIEDRFFEAFGDDK